MPPQTAGSGGSIGSTWDVDATPDRLRDFVRETFGDPERIGVLDEIGFLKKGVAWVGCSGRTGARPAVENCQIGVFLGVPDGVP